MQQRELGSCGLKIAPLMLGGNVFGWTADEATSFKLLDAFLGAGLNAIDTADVYSRWVPGHKGGESETILGRWLKARGVRSRIVLATKVGFDKGPDGKGLSRERIRLGIEASLRRLETDYIDLYQSHIDDESTPLEETLATYADLIAEGKVRAIGASNYGSDRLAAALGAARAQHLPRYESLQPLYNLMDRAGFEAELEPLCLKERIGVIAYYGLAAGFLTGKYRSSSDFQKSPRGARMPGYLNERGLRVLKALDGVAARTGSSPAQVALAWLMARPAVTAAIASATNLEQLAELVAATRLTLDQAAIRELDAASAP
jgi:aryl-alcohol dehydrogenase-like predicted oxidoreductase